ncbi:MAG: hypothetical protein HC884_19105 [Chloroflexaceae bacterium]|nr:hypothetical protein [Chloroflexaceae bacterium]
MGGAGAGLVLHPTGDLATPSALSPILTHVLALLTALFAFPIAAGWGPMRQKPALRWTAPNRAWQNLSERWVISPGGSGW